MQPLRENRNMFKYAKQRVTTGTSILPWMELPRLLCGIFSLEDACNIAIHLPVPALIPVSRC